MYMDSKYLVQIAAEACDEKKAKNIRLINVSEVSTLTDWILITEGLSDVQVKAIINSVENKLEQRVNMIPIRKEGLSEAKWALLDYGDIIVNVFQPKERNFYELESFWSHGQTSIYKQIDNK
tara:strand:- start:1112 stop:1477 length:366 start_codon:yes stop_codon:yes gene_type:complete